VETLSRHFSSPVEDRFGGIEYAAGDAGISLIAGCAGHLECRIETRHSIGDHVIFIGRVLHSSHSNRRPSYFSKYISG
jgi:3-hydroxy-9,10-secoandrosta-1,3,5(10)-triene-9,17-dione monooxygenase reductase component